MERFDGSFPMDRFRWIVSDEERMTQIRLAAMIAVLMAARTLSAGIEYQFRQIRRSEVETVPSLDITGKAVIDGDRSRVDFMGGTPYTPGTYVISLDGARSLTFVDPAHKTYAEVNLAGLASTDGSARIDVANLKSHLQSLSDHPVFAGLPTDHTRLTVKYDITMNVGNLALKQKVETIIDKWTTSAFGDINDTFLASGSLHTGNPKLDEIVDAETTRIKGLPLRQVVQVITTSENSRLGGSQLKFSPTRRQTTELVVNSVQSKTIAPNAFQVPLTYTKTDTQKRGEDTPVKMLSLEPSGE
jgi:hypothetical protein